MTVNYIPQSGFETIKYMQIITYYIYIDKIVEYFQHTSVIDSFVFESIVIADDSIQFNIISEHYVR